MFRFLTLLTSTGMLLVVYDTVMTHISM